MQTLIPQTSPLPLDLEGASPEEILNWGLSSFGSDITLACSFGAEDVALVHMLAGLERNARIFVLDTGRLHQETYDVMEACRTRYRVRFDIFHPLNASVEQLVQQRGPNSFYQSIEDRKLCCGIRKVEPLARALRGKKAWITGLRREQAVTRSSLPKIETDEAHGGILKLNPLAAWSEEQVWEFIRENDVPYNALHDQGFPSVGCEPCTRAVKPGEDVRAGRWWWESPEHKECGLHLKQAQRSFA